MDWQLVREALRVMHSRWRSIYGTHRRRMQFALVLLVLSRVWKPWLRRSLQRLYSHLHAEKPTLHYQPTVHNERVLAQCPMMQSAYHPPWFLSNGHAQTLVLGAAMKSTQPAIQYERQLAIMPDGGTISLDWALPPRGASDNGSSGCTNHAIPPLSQLDPTLCTMVILPGLTGGSDEFYIRSLVHEMLVRGWQVVVLNARGCADTPLTTPQLFSCAFTGDLRVVLEQLRDQYDFVRNSALVAVGFSMGSNVLVKYLGEYQHDALVTAAVSVGNPFDMVAASRNLKESFLYRNTYYAALTMNLKMLFFEKSNAHEAFKNHPLVDLEALRNAKDIDEFDEKLTCLVFGYKDAMEYYTDGSSGTRIPLVCVPLLCINAQDDPISPLAAIPVDAIRENPHVILCLTKSGGHLAFYESAYHPDKPSRRQGTSSTSPSSRTRHPSVWSSRAVAEFAESFRHSSAQVEVTMAKL